MEQAVSRKAVGPRLQADQLRRILALDGLRAFAVVAVVVYHLELRWGGRELLPGGFLGVDLFFVLSGFLIGQLVVREIDRTGGVDLVRFWARRFRRLMPASFTVLLAITLWGCIVGWGRDIQSDVLASLFWFQNWHLIAGSQSYAGQFAAASPLTHFWSLSIEEQWYLLFPVLSFVSAGALRRHRRSAGAVVLAAAVVSAILLWFRFDPSDSRAYFGTDTRIFALLLGCGAAFLLPRGAGASSRRVTVGLMTLGLTAWFALCLTARVDAPWMYRGGFVLASVVSLAAVVGASVSNVRWFDAAPIQWLGTRSYGIYLWHWPVIVALTEDRMGISGAGLTAVRLGVVAVLVELSYRFIEQPIRVGRGQRVAATRVVPIGLVCSMAVGLVVVVAPIDVPTGTSQDVLAGAERALTETSTTPLASTSLDVVIVGDSVGFGLGYDVAPEDVGGVDLRLRNLAMMGCGLTRLAYSALLYGQGLQKCLDIDSSWRDELARQRPDWVVYPVGLWDSTAIEADGRSVEVGSQEWTRIVGERVEQAFDVLTAGGTPLMVVAPGCRSVDPSVAALPDLTGADLETYVGLVHDVVDGMDRPITILDPSDWECDQSGKPATLADGTLIRDDGVHFSEAGKLEFWKWLTPSLADGQETEAGDASTTTSIAPPDTTASTTPPIDVSVLIVGDSLAGSLARGVTDVGGAGAGVTLGAYYYPGCGLIPGDVVAPDGTIRQAAAVCQPVQDGLSTTFQDSRPDAVVVLTGLYEAYDRRVGDVILKSGTPEYELHITAGLDRLVQAVGGGTTPITILSPPCLPTGVTPGADPAASAFAPARIEWLAGVFERYASSHPEVVVYQDIREMTCGPDGEPVDDIDGAVLFSDPAHFAPDGALGLWTEIAPEVLRLATSGR